LCEFLEGFPMVPDVLNSFSLLASPERHLADFAPETNLGFGGLGCVLLGDNGLVQDSADFSDPQGIGQAYCSLSCDCYFPSTFVFLPRLMASGSFFKLEL